MSFADGIQMTFFSMLTCTIGSQGGPNKMAAANFLWLPFLNNSGSIHSSKNNTEYNPREHVIYLISLPLRNLNPEPSSSPSSNRLAYNSLVLRSNINSEQRSALTSLLANACRHENPAIIKITTPNNKSETKRKETTSGVFVLGTNMAVAFFFQGHPAQPP